MTSDPDAPDLAEISGLPRIVLDADGLDALELAVGGALDDPWSILGAPEGRAVVLTDAENTPLARIVPGGGPALRPLRALARGTVPQWDETIRRPASSVRAEVASIAPDGPVVALVVDDVPSYADVERLVEAAVQADAAVALVVVPVGRRPSTVEIGWAALTRAGLAVGEGIKAARPGLRVIPLVLPWPAHGLDLAEVLSRFGATATVSVSELRGPANPRPIDERRSGFEQHVREAYPPASVDEILRVRSGRSARGAVVFFTGLSGSGKSTIARALADELRDGGDRLVTLLDGDEVRQLLSSDLGFDAASRAANIERIAYVASLVAASGGIAVAAPIAPFADGRRRARARVVPESAFVLVHVSTPLAVCEERDRKGLYRRARAGEIPDFTGISSPYEAPDDADVTIDTTFISVSEAVTLVRSELERRLASD